MTNNQSAKTIVKQLTKKFLKKQGIFQNTINVEDFAEKVDKHDRANFMFYVVLLDAGMKSETLYNGAIKLYQSSGDMYFSPKGILANESEIKNILSKYLHVRYPNSASDYWISSSKLLHDKYNDSAKNIFQKESAKTVFENINEFKGYGTKKSSLLLRSFINIYNLEYSDIWDFPMPIDRHKLRLSYEWGFIDKNDHKKQNVKKVSDFWKKVCKEAGINWWIFDRAFWIYGAKSK